MFKKHKKNKGSTLVVTLFLLAIILISALSIALVAIKERKASIGSSEANKAYQSAETGVENVMQAIIKGKYPTVKAMWNGESYTCSSGIIVGTGYTVELLDDTDSQIDCMKDISIATIAKIKAVGSYKNSTRAISAPVSFDFLDEDLIGYWKLNEGSGDTAFDSTENEDGKLQGDAKFVEEDGLDVLELDGNGDYVEVDGLLGKSHAVTLSAWVKRNLSASAVGQEVISVGDYVGIRIISNITVRGFYYHLPNSWNETNATVSGMGNDWHHIVYTVDPEGAEEEKVYFDGEPESNTSSSRAIVYNGQGSETFLGKHGKDMKFYFNGEMRDVRVYDRILSEDEVMILYNVTNPET